MSKEELQAKLDKAGIEYDKRFGEKRLQALLEEHVPVEKKADEPVYSEAKIKAVEEKLSDAPIVEDLYEITTPVEDGRVTKGGIFIPGEVMRGMAKTGWVYVMDCTSSACNVYKGYNGRREFVRTYSTTDQGENFKALAQQFVDKNNR